MKSYILVLLLLIASIGHLRSQTPSFKVDLNQYGRQNSEVNNPNFTPWTYAIANTASGTIQDVVVTLRGLTMSNADTLTWINWYKGGITTSDEARLTCDGAYSKVLEMTLHGLPAGTHTLLTYHNTTDAAYSTSTPTGFVFNPIKIYLNGKVMVDSLMPTNRQLLMAKVPVSYLSFGVDSGQDVVVRFEPILISPKEGTPFNKVVLNGFELNTPNSMHQAYSPYPTDRDLHVDGDAGQVTLRWNCATTSVSHNLYLGTDSVSVADAKEGAIVFVGNKSQNDTTYIVPTYSMDTYFWRVDEISSDGVVTKGNTWRFRTRQLAFPEAEGYGRYATGGRGGEVVHVTSLNDDGAGSFRQAVTNTGGIPRTVVFDVSGIIRLESRLAMSKYITVAGQTAPGKGICFRGAPIGVNSESVCQFVRLRLGGGETYDGMGMAGADHAIIDHCSIGWTIDEAFSSRNAKNITLQRTLISEALNIAGHKNYAAGTAHGYAGSIGGDCGSFHHNLLAHNEGRNWSLAGGLDGNGYYAGKLDIFNTVVYNWRSRATDGGANQVNFVNNYYKKGPASTQEYILNAQLEGTGKGSQSYCYAGNIKTKADGTVICDGTDNACSRKYTLSNEQVLDWNVFVAQPFFPSYAKIESAKDAYKSVLSDVGCSMPLLDDHDKRIVDETLNGTYTYKGSVSGYLGLIDNEADAGGYEDYPEETRATNYDTDRDGLPGWWETIIGTNPNGSVGDFSDANADAAKDGYTNLDVYLQWLSHPHYKAEVGKPFHLGIGQFTAGYTASPQYSFLVQTNCSVYILSGTDTAVVVPSAVGLAKFQFTVTDSEGSSMTRLVNLQVVDGGNSGIESTTNKNYSIYPAVVRDKVTVTGLEGVEGVIAIWIVNLSGQVVSQTKASLSEGTIVLNVSRLGQGIYFVVDSNKDIIGRFVKL
jgi:hypothetical protein